MIELEAGSVPSRPFTFIVRDDLDNPVNLVGYDTLRLEILGEDGDLVDLRGVIVQEIESVIGGLTVVLPKTRSLFENRGIYRARLVMERTDGSRDITRSVEIKVRDFGRIK